MVLPTGDQVAAAQHELHVVEKFGAARRQQLLKLLSFARYG
jgi:hypothetical protein